MPKAHYFFLCCKAATTKEQEANRNFDLYFHSIISLILIAIVLKDKGEIINPITIVVRIFKKARAISL